jgi:hypothetical protein
LALKRAVSYAAMRGLNENRKHDVDPKNFGPSVHVSDAKQPNECPFCKCNEIQYF